MTTTRTADGGRAQPHATGGADRPLFLDRAVRHAAFALLVLAGLLFLVLALAVDGDYAWPLLVIAPLIAVGVVDIRQTVHAIRFNYPVVGHLRWIFEDLRPYLRQYIVEDDLEGRPYNRLARTLVYERAKGDEDAQPLGTQLDVYAQRYEVLVHSVAPHPVATEPFRVTVGGPQCLKPYSAQVLNISAMSFGSLSARAIEALNAGAARGGFYHDTGEGGFSPYHRMHGGDIVWELGSGYFGCRDDQGRFDPDHFAETARLDQVKMIEIKLSQGAKPGHGGMLPGPKVTAEIAATRKVPEGVDCISPARHSAFDTPEGMMRFVQQLRDLSGGKPVGIKLCVGQPHEIFAIVKAMLSTGILVDFIVVDGAEGGTGAAPREFSDHLGLPMREGLVLVRNALVGAGLRPHVKIAAAGKMTSAFDLAAALAIGADWCNAARAFMFAIGCVQSVKCHTGRCPTGVATQDPDRQKGLVVEDKAERVRRYQARTVHALADLVAAAGLDHPDQLEPRHLLHRRSPNEIVPIDRLYPFLKPGVLIEAPDATPYAADWAAADPASFAPRRIG
ncbi:FMN-binding glutamate synthase family protein [Tistrella bauzanensis]|uniref:FMN-binding glutamate synthase family protein n=1 Tax=Tistrella arctica TaxID=3133430 RepID=A0ABU9YFK5_9PROT